VFALKLDTYESSPPAPAAILCRIKM